MTAAAFAIAKEEKLVGARMGAFGPHFGLLAETAENLHQMHPNCHHHHQFGPDNITLGKISALGPMFACSQS